MRLDKFGNPIFNENDLISALYKGQSLSADMFVEQSDGVKSLIEQSGLQFWIPLDNYELSVEEYDAAMQSDWQMPDEYKTMDIEGFLVNACPKENYQRLIDELVEFKDRNMLDLLRWLKYLVDTMTEKNIVWGIGRGSSVSSYVLFLIGIHSIDPIKYNLDWREFLR